MQKWLKSPKVCTLNTKNIMKIEWKFQMKKKWKRKLGMLSYT